MQTSYALEAEGLSKSYGNTLVFKGFGLKAPKEGLIAVYGPNGSGKTTLLRVLGLLDEPDSGTLKVMGVPVAGVKASSFQRFAEIISFSFQEPLLLPGLTAYENIKISTKLNPRKVEEVLESLNLKELLKKKPHQLSGSERKRFDVARAVSRDTPILIMDEALAFLDIVNRERMIDLIIKESKERAVIISLTEVEQKLREEATLIVNMLQLK